MKKLISVLLLLLLAIGTASAQGGLITYGSATVDALSAQAPIAIYTFQGTQDDQVTIQAIAITPGLNLTLTLQSGAEILATNDNDPYTAGATDARIDSRLPATSAYLILVSSANGGTGNYLLKLTGQAQAAKTIITGSPADVNITAEQAITALPLIPIIPLPLAYQPQRRILSLWQYYAMTMDRL